MSKAIGRFTHPPISARVLIARMTSAAQKMKGALLSGSSRRPLKTCILFAASRTPSASHQYVSKIADKVAREGLIEADRTQIEQRMQFTRENYRMMREQLLKIVYWKDGDPGKRPWHSEVTDAAKTIVMLDLALLKAEIENRHVQEANRRPRKGVPVSTSRT